MSALRRFVLRLVNVIHPERAESDLAHAGSRSRTGT